MISSVVSDEPLLAGGVDPRQLPGNPDVSLRYHRFKPWYWPRQVVKLCIKMKVKAPFGYWVMNNKVRSLNQCKRCFAARKHWKGFYTFGSTFECSCEDDEDTESFESAEVESPSSPVMAVAMSTISLEDPPLLTPVRAKHVFNKRLLPAGQCVELD